MKLLIDSGGQVQRIPTVKLSVVWASNFFYIYQFNNVNDLLFNLRTKRLNNIFYWGTQMVSSMAIGYVLDFSFRSRRTRAKILV
uniref:Uncharacterized protein n=1 Tax=Musa acuminata subsp. malaccensis TaxID=214687 RepID=A0A804HZN1_MUSAM